MDLADISLRSSIESIGSSMSIDPDDSKLSLLSLSIGSLDQDACARSSEEAMNSVSYIFEGLPLSGTMTTDTNSMHDREPITTRVDPSSQKEKNGSISFNRTIRRVSPASEDLAEEVAKDPSLFFDDDSACDVEQRFTSSSPWIPTKEEEERQKQLASSQNQQPTPMQSSRNASISSSDWVKDFEGEPVDSGPLYPSLFMSNNSIASFVAQLSTSTSPPPHEDVPQPSTPHKGLSVHPSPKSTVANDLGASFPTISIDRVKKTSPLPSNPITKKKKKRKPRVLDESRVAEPTDDDVLFGRGPSINKHPGNIKFRQTACELHSWYVKSSKQQKEKITNLLVESVRPHRFLEKGKDKLWHEVVDGEHYKASQAFRDISKFKWFKIPGNFSKSSF